jgi:hypothetical protein
MRRSASVIGLALGLVLALALESPVVASEEAVRRHGSCSGGPGHWTLRVRRVDGSLRIRFVIDDVAQHQSWQVFMSDNGTRIFSGTRRSTSEGKVRVRVRTRNRAGTDRIAASGVNAAVGTTCEGSLSV